MAASIRQAAEKSERHAVVEPQAFTPADFWAWTGVSHEHSEWSPEHRSSPLTNHREFHFRINKIDFFEPTEFLGHGSLGMVETLKIRGKDIEVACKSARGNHITNLRKEIELLKRVHNIMSPVGQGDLAKYLEEPNQDVLSSSCSAVSRGWFLCLASALKYLHANGIRHEDIKPSNIIYLGNSILFTDFGSSTTFNPDDTTSTESQAYGTARYQAPEVRDKTQAHGARSDIFSLGCVFLEMLTVAMGLPLSQLHSFCSVNAGSISRTPGSFLYCSAIDQLDEWFFGQMPGIELAVIWKDIVQPMLHFDRKKRPKALHVVQLLETGFIPAILPNYCTDCNDVFDFQARCKPGLIEFCALPSVSDDQWPWDVIHNANSRVRALTNLYHMLVSQVPPTIWQKSFPTGQSMEGFRGHLAACLTEVLQYASFKGNEGLVKALLRYRGDINAPGQHWGSALQAARSGGFERIVQVLHENGAIDEPRGNLGTFLAVLSYHGNETLASMLLKGDPAPGNSWDELSKALDIASYRGHGPVIEALLRAGADPNAGSDTCGTALIAASCHGHVNAVHLLLRAGADVNMQAAPYHDALCAASQAGHAGIVKILLGRAVRDESRRERCERAIQAATEAGHDSIVQCIKDWSSQPSTEDGMTDDDTCNGESNNGEPTSLPLIIDLSRTTERESRELFFKHFFPETPRYSPKCKRGSMSLSDDTSSVSSAAGYQESADQ